MPKVKKNNYKAIVLIKKSNDLVESRYKFDIWETRFFLSLLSKIRRETTEFPVCRIFYSEVIKTFGLKSGDAYGSLREAAKKLMKKTVRTSYYVDGVKREQEVSLITKIDYMAAGQKSVESHEYIDVKFLDEMKPLLLELSKSFTAYDFANIVKLGVYSIRIYELLKQYESIGARTLNVDEIKVMFELTTEYPRYNDFYNWVIKPAEREINKHTDLLITNIEKLKEGRRIVALRFKFRAKTPQELAKIRGNVFQEPLSDSLQVQAMDGVNVDVPQLLPSVIVPKKEFTPAADNKNIVVIQATTVVDATDESAKEKLITALFPIVVTKFGVSLKMFMRLVDENTEGVIRQAVQVTEKALSSGKTTNSAGFFVDAVRNHYQDLEEQTRQAEAAKTAAKIAEKQAKAEAAKRAEAAVQQQKEQGVHSESTRKINIIKALLAADSPLLYQAIETMNMNKTIDEILESGMLTGKLMYLLQKIEPKVFL